MHSPYPTGFPGAPVATICFTTFYHFGPHPTPKGLSVNNKVEGVGCRKGTSTGDGAVAEEKREASRFPARRPLGIALIGVVRGYCRSMLWTSRTGLRGSGSAG